MGNQSSKRIQRIKDESHVQSILNQWSNEEQRLLKKPFILDSDVDRGTSTLHLISHSITKRLLLNFCQLHLPMTFEIRLAEAFALYLCPNGQDDAAKEERLVFRDYLDMVQSFMYGTTLATGEALRPVDAFVRLFCLLTAKKGVSLTTFMSWVVKTGVNLWYEGTEITFIDYDRNKEQRDRLVKTLLIAFLDDPVADEFADDEQAADKKKDDDIHAWLSLATAEPFPVDDSDNVLALTTWMEKTPDFVVLMKIVARCYFLGPVRLNANHHSIDTTAGNVAALDQDTLHRYRLARLLAPRLAEPFLLLTAYDFYYISLSLPPRSLSWSAAEQTQLKQAQPLQFQRIFDSRSDGSSWQVFAHQLVKHPGSTLLIIRTKEAKAVFGGYIEEPWEPVTDWYGSPSNFLFRVSATGRAHDRLGTWLGTSINNHYQYLCWGKKSLPNGLGMGGQFDYAGLWLHENFTHGYSRAGPLCSTYQSPKLCQEDPFEIDQVEVWLLRPTVKEEEDQAPGSSVLDRAEEMQFLEMAGKKLYSKDLEKPEKEPQ